MVEQELDRPVWCRRTPNELLDEPPVPLWNRRGIEEADYIGVYRGNKHTAIFQLRERLRLDEKMKTRKSARRKPLRENCMKCWTLRGFVNAPLPNDNAFVLGAMKLAP